MKQHAQMTPERNSLPKPPKDGMRVLQRKCGCGNSTQTGGDCASCSDEKKKKVQRRALGTSESEVPASVDRVLQSPGRPLDTDTRASMESRFGHDFSRVRVHTDTHAASSAREINAEAYTSGSHIVFGDRRFEPHTSAGRHLLAHELAHVVQQHGPSIIPAGVGPADDVHERAADRIANDVMTQGAVFTPQPVAKPWESDERPHAIQRSFGSVLLDIVLFIPRLFGLEVFTAGQLREYLEGLRQRRGPQRSLFSDNMARACVNREAEFGPYSTDDKTWLIQDMLDGHVSFLDEGAINNLLRRSTDRAQVVANIGRPTLWQKFTGRNRRIVEALTLTASDANDALVERLRTLAPDELQDYTANNNDPALREIFRRAAALHNITAPVPASSTVSAAGSATFQINGIDVTAEPDVRSTDPALGSGNFTSFELRVVDQGEGWVDAQGIVQRFRPLRIAPFVRTTFGPQTEIGGQSGYGRGTTSQDRAAGNTSVRFHESRHAQDWFDYLRTHPLPQFTGAVGMTEAQYNQAREDYIAAARRYVDAAQAYSTRMTDCVGTLPSSEHFRQANVTTNILPDVATICHQQGAGQ